MDEDKTLTAEEAAAKLLIHKDTLYMLVRRRKIPHFKIGRRIFFKSKALDSWIQLSIDNSVVPQVVDGPAGALRRA